MSETTVVFDFDKTLTKRDTLIPFYLFCAKRNVLLPVKILAYLGVFLASRVKLANRTWLQKVGVRLFLGGLSKSQFENLAERYSTTIELRSETVSDFKELMSRGVKPWIVSASFPEYIKPLFPDVEILGSIVEFDERGLSSLGLHCYEGEKVVQLKKKNIQKIDILYTDSMRDRPMAEMAELTMLVKPDRIIRCESLKEFLLHA